MTLDELRARATVFPGAGCWLWRGAKNSHGYGTVRHDGRTWAVHRLAVLLSGRPLPAGLDLDHLCSTRHCFRPDHLEAVTTRENLLRSANTVAGKHARKTHCKNGHPFDDSNTIIINTERGWRDCRACRVAKRIRARARKSATP